MKKSIILFLFLASLISCTANNTVTEDIFKTEKEGMKEVNNNATIEVIVGEQIKLFSYAEYPRGNPSDKIQWSVSNTSLANLNNGVLTALALGSVTVIAKSTENPAKNKRFIFKIVKEKIIPATPTPVGESTPLVSVSSGMTANPNSTPNPNSSASNSPVTSPTPIPIPTPSKLAIDNAEKISFITGQIYNTDGSPVKNCKITATSIDKSLVWSTEQTVKDGVYLIKDVPINVVIDLIVEKDGWTTRTRTEVFNKNSNSENYNFGGSKADLTYAIQDGPEITKVTINSKDVKVFNPTRTVSDLSIPPEGDDITAVDLEKTSSISVSLTFSEPVNQDDVQNSLKIMSQKLDQQNDFVYTFDQATPDASFNWNDTNTKVSFTCNSKVELGLVDSNRIIYRLQFVSPFKDSGAAKSVKNRFINFNGQTFGDYVNFSIKTSN